MFSRRASVSIPPRAARGPSPQRGFTLVEMLVAVTVSLVMILAMVQVFQVIGTNVSTGRAIVEMQGQLRVVALRLQQDLEGVTVPVRPWPDSFAAQGYLEYSEGPGRDWNPYNWTSTSLPVATANPLLGDYDDILMFTTRSAGEPFVGQFDPDLTGSPAPIDSKVAEVGWWTMVVDANGNGVADEAETVTVHRRAWLVRPDLNRTERQGAVAILPNTSPQQLRDDLVAWLDANDVSVHVEPAAGGGIKLVANSLADLTQRVNRMGHWSLVAEDNAVPPVAPSSFAAATAAFPHPILRNQNVVSHGSTFATLSRSSTSLAQLTLGDTRTSNLREGGDVILANALSMDVQVYDPTVPLKGDTGAAGTATVALTPADQGWYAVPVAGNTLGVGAYVDLAYDVGNANLFFANRPVPRSGFSWLPGYPTPTYCTWSLHYEKNGIDEDGDGLVDEGTDGIDNDGVNGVDDLQERETSPPYPVPLRGLRVRIRMIEPDTRQVRQITVTSDFTPE